MPIVETPAMAGPADAPEDAVAEVQSIDSFISLEDGQPGAPGKVEATMSLSRAQLGARGLITSSEVSYTPDRTGFLAEGAFAASIETDAGDKASATALTLGWGQRWWAAGHGAPWMPTLAGLTELNVGMPGPDQGLTVGETLTMAETLGAATVYVNGTVERSMNVEAGTRAFVLGTRAGVQWAPPIDDVRLVGAWVREQDDALGVAAHDRAELGLTIGLGEHLTLGPGLALSLDEHHLGGGFTLLLE